MQQHQPAKWRHYNRHLVHYGAVYVPNMPCSWCHPVDAFWIAVQLFCLHTIAPTKCCCNTCSSCCQLPPLMKQTHSHTCLTPAAAVAAAASASPFMSSLFCRPCSAPSGAPMITTCWRSCTLDTHPRVSTYGEKGVKGQEGAGNGFYGQWPRMNDALGVGKEGCQEQQRASMLFCCSWAGCMKMDCPVYAHPRESCSV